MENFSASQDYLNNRKKCILTGFGLLVFLFLVVVISLVNGAMEIGILEVLKIMGAKIFGLDHLLLGIPDNAVSVVWSIRMPRILSSIVVGAGLAVAGAIFQSILQNPLADPYTMGVSTGAAFGASIAILFNVIYAIYLPVSLFALVFAFATLVIVLLVARKGGGNVVSNLIISGIIVGSILSAGISFVKMLAGESVSAIVFWLMGTFDGANWADVLLVFPVVLVAVIIATIYSVDLNIMALGDKNAQSLGVNTKSRRMLFLIIGASITAVCVSICGVIGFVGLMVPHLLRFRFSSDNKQLIPLSTLVGANILCIADNLTRVFSGGEIPVGVLTTLLGGPFFIYIFVRRKGGKVV